MQRPEDSMERIKTSLLKNSKLPLVIEPRNGHYSFGEFLRILESENEYFQSKLLEHGGLLFRNFPVNKVEDFAEVIKNLKTGSMIDYIGGDSPRTKIHEGVYTSTEAPPSIKIPLHNELSFVKNYPSHIYFYCETPPKERGETIIADAKKVFRDIDPKVRKRFIDNGLKYYSRYFYRSPLLETINRVQKGHRSWIEVFETRDKNEVERLCKSNDFSYKWNANDWLEVSQVRPAVLNHPITGETVWFNQAHLFDFNPRLLDWWRYLGTKILYFRKHMRLHEVYFADDSPIPLKDLYHILDVLDANTISFPWKKGDVLVLDNVLSMHGRAVFSGKRRILAAMTGS